MTRPEMNTSAETSPRERRRWTILFGLLVFWVLWPWWFLKSPWLIHIGPNWMEPMWLYKAYGVGILLYVPVGLVLAALLRRSGDRLGSKLRGSVSREVFHLLGVITFLAMLILPVWVAIAHTTLGEQTYCVAIDIGGFPHPDKHCYLALRQGRFLGVSHGEEIVSFDHWITTPIARPTNLLETKHGLFPGNGGELVFVYEGGCSLVYDPAKQNIYKAVYENVIPNPEDAQSIHEVSPFILLGPDDELPDAEAQRLRAYYEGDIRDPEEATARLAIIERDAAEHPNAQARQLAAELAEIIRQRYASSE